MIITKDKINKNDIKRGLHIILLGGTIDFEANTFVEIQSKKVDTLIPREHSIIPNYLNNQGLV